MNIAFIILAMLAALAVLASFGVGMYAMVKGGDFNKKHANKLMQARVGLQGLALALLALAYFTSQG